MQKQDITLSSQTYNNQAPVLNAVAAPVIIIKPSCQILFANHAANNLFSKNKLNGETGGNLCHSLLFGFSSPCQKKGLPCPLTILLETKQETIVTRAMETAEGNTKWLEIKATPVLDDSGEVVEIITTIQEITKRKEMEISLKRYSQSQKELFRVSQEITSTTDLKQLYRHIVSHAKDLLQFDFSTLMLLTADRKGLLLHDTIGFPESIINSYTVLEGVGLATYVAKIKQPEVVVDFLTENRFEVPKLISDRNIRSALCVPLVIENKLLGILVGHTLEQRIFTDQEIILYHNLAYQAAIAIFSANSLKELKISEKRYQDLFEHSLDLIQMVGPDGDILYANQAWKQVLGYNDQEISTLSAFDVIHPDSRKNCMTEFQKLHRGENVEYIETTFVSKEGKKLTVEGNITSKITDGKLISTQGIFRDITERKRLERKLEKISMTDDLTGLLNRRGFFSLGAKQVAIAERTEMELFLLYADLDNMKFINDKLGHKVGDEALIETATLLKDTFRTSDTIARMGGDEFTILIMANPTTNDKKAVLKRFETNLAQLNGRERSYELSISTGIASYNGNPPSSIEELVSRADTLMYENKRKRKAVQGHNRARD